MPQRVALDQDHGLRRPAGLSARTRWRTAGAPQNAIVPGFSAVAEQGEGDRLAGERAEVDRPPLPAVRRWSRCGSAPALVLPARWTATRKVTGSSSGVPRARSSTGREGSVTWKRAVSGGASRASRGRRRAAPAATGSGPSALATPRSAFAKVVPPPAVARSPSAAERRSGERPSRVGLARGPGEHEAPARRRAAPAVHRPPRSVVGLRAGGGRRQGEQDSAGETRGQQDRGSCCFWRRGWPARYRFGFRLGRARPSGWPK